MNEVHGYVGETAPFYRLANYWLHRAETAEKLVGIAVQALRKEARRGSDDAYVALQEIAKNCID